MSGEVLPFRARPAAAGDRRPPPPGDGYDGLRCPECGSAWLYLGWVDENDELQPAMVCVNAEGSVTGYTGTPHCCECYIEILP